MQQTFEICVFFKIDYEANIRNLCSFYKSDNARSEANIRYMCSFFFKVIMHGVLIIRKSYILNSVLCYVFFLGRFSNK